MIRAILAASFVAAATASSAGALDALRWNKRIVIVFAAAGDPRVEAQRQSLLRDEPALADRDLLAFAVVGDAVEAIYGTPPQGQSAAGLRRRFDVAATSFTTVLIGKDGGVKWRGDRPIGLVELEGVIDAMPMRRNAR